MRNVRQLLDVKGSTVWSIEPEASVLEAIKLMAKKEIGAVLVVKDGHPVGMLSERDYARKVILEGKSSHDTPVADIMSSPVIYARPKQTIRECMAVMTERRCRHLPVLDGEELVGMISINDLVRDIIADQQFQISQLENYISG